MSIINKFLKVDTSIKYDMVFGLADYVAGYEIINLFNNQMTHF